MADRIRSRFRFIFKRAVDRRVVEGAREVLLNREILLAAVVPCLHGGEGGGGQGGRRVGGNEGDGSVCVCVCV